MIDPKTNSLLVLYDDAQSIYGDKKRRKFSIKSVGIQAVGRDGAEPLVVNLPSLKDEAEFIVKRPKDAHRAGMPWREMAVIYREYERDANLIRKLLPAHGIPLVVIPGADRLNGAGELSAQEAKLLYVAMTRATRELVVCGVGT